MRRVKAQEDPWKITNLEHELAVSEVYAILFPHKMEDGSRVLAEWDRDRSNSVYAQVRYDARMKLKGRLYYLEVERGNHAILDPKQHPDYQPLVGEKDIRVNRETWRKSLNQKLENYIAYQQDSGERFQVLITLEDWRNGVYDPHGTQRLLRDVLMLLHSLQRGNMFLVCLHRDLVGDRDHTVNEIHNEVLGDPFGPIWYSPKEPETMALGDV
jgi:hypothetical protein